MEHQSRKLKDKVLQIQVECIHPNMPLNPLGPINEGYSGNQFALIAMITPGVLNIHYCLCASQPLQ